jgi:hypothetical protein
MRFWWGEGREAKRQEIPPISAHNRSGGDDPESATPSEVHVTSLPRSLKTDTPETSDNNTQHRKVRPPKVRVNMTPDTITFTRSGTGYSERRVFSINALSSNSSGTSSKTSLPLAHDNNSLSSPSLQPKAEDGVTHKAHSARKVSPPRSSISTVSPNRLPLEDSPIIEKREPFVVVLPPVQNNSIQGGRFAPDGQSFALLQADTRKLWIWHLLPGGRTLEEEHLRVGLRSSIVNWSYDGKCIALRSDEQRCVWAIRNGVASTLGSMLSETRTRNVRVSLTPDADELIEVSRSSIRRYQLPEWTSQLLYEMDLHENLTIRHLLVAPNARYIVVAIREQRIPMRRPGLFAMLARSHMRNTGQDGTHTRNTGQNSIREDIIKVFTYPEVRPYVEIRLRKANAITHESCRHISISPDSRLLAYYDLDNLVLWNFRSRSAIRKFARYDGSALLLKDSYLVFSKDSELLARSESLDQESSSKTFSVYEWGIGIRYCITRRISFDKVDSHQRDLPFQFMQDGSMVGIVTDAGVTQLCEIVSAEQFQEIRALGRQYPKVQITWFSPTLLVEFSRRME